MSSLFLGLPAPLRQAGRRHRPPARAAAVVLPSVRRLRAAPPCRTAVHPHISPAPLSLGLRRRHGRVAALANPVTMFYTLSAVGRRRRRRNGVYASLFGVGAPEALVIGVVALLVFGPKGLAEVARNLGKTLRAFQPTIRELQDVSREFRSTLEREIGLDEDPPSSNYRPTTTNSSQQPIMQQPAVDPISKPEAVPYTSDELMKVTEEQLAASASAAWNTQQSPTSQKQEIASSSQSNDTILSGGSDGPGVARSESQSNDTALSGGSDGPGVATSESQSNDTTLSGGSDGPGVATSESNSNPSEKTQPRDEA